MKKTILHLGLLWCLTLVAEPVATGRVVSQETGAGKAEIRPEAPGSAETVKVALSPGDAQINWSGRRIRYRLTKAESGLRAEQVFPAEPEELRRVAEVTDALRRETLDKGRLVTRMPSELTPNMALWDQDGRLVTKKDFLGHALAVNFIFTSCRNARMCPASTKAMKQLADTLAKEPKLAGVRLVTITFDPETDSPGLLRAYADGYGIDHARHRFMTGDPGQIRDLMKHYGILTVRDDGTIVHNAALILVSPEGRIVQRREGATFDPADVAQAFLRLAEASPK